MAKRKIRVVKLQLGDKYEWCVIVPMYGFTVIDAVSITRGFHSQQAAFVVAYRRAGTGSTSATTQTNVTPPMDMYSYYRRDWV